MTELGFQGQNGHLTPELRSPGSVLNAVTNVKMYILKDIMTHRRMPRTNKKSDTHEDHRENVPQPPNGDAATRVLEGAEQGVNLTTLTWVRFKDIFYEKYFTGYFRGLLKKEFMSFRQRDTSMAEFVRKFDRGCHFVPLIARDATEKLRHLLDGLRPTIRRDVMLMRLRKRQQNQHKSQPIKRQFTGPLEAQGRQKPQGQFKKPRHQKPPQNSEKDHKAADCPRDKGHIIGRAYVMHAEVAEAEPDTTLITDSGATHSFISETFVKRLKIIPEDLDLEFKVFILSGEKMVTTSTVRNLELRLLKNAVQADLIVLPMPEFNIILGMDWLYLN
ncbi:uncharacterized protein LOC142520262 [Primulina tabacum]|uniref:uncharacterized protein LOC142520262 n=1 Tax=Primulina tabacum TaxID=48773 RepID=UPI003F5ACF0B